MRLIWTVVDTGQASAGFTDVLVEAPEGATLGDVVDGLHRCVGCPEGAVLSSGGRPLDLAQPLGEPPLLHGATLALGRAAVGSMTLGSEAVIHLDVVGGPGAGTVVALGRGTHVVGRSGECTVRLEDSTVSRRHLELSVGSTGVTVRALTPTNTSSVNELELGGAPTTVRVGDRVRVGSTTLTLRVASVRPAATTSAAGRCRVHRPPRFSSASPIPQIEFPRRPERPQGSRLPLIAALVPMALSVVLAVVLRSPVMMLFAMLTPAMLLGQWWSDRRHGRTSYRRQLADHAASRRRAETALREALDREYVVRHEEAPDLAMAALVVSSVSTRLWERRPGDPDYLALRLGVGPQQPRTTVTGDADDLLDVPLLEVPQVLRLRELGVLGVAGPRDRTLAVARSMIGQLCAWHSPRALRLVVLTAAAAAAEAWWWTARLPHLAPLGPTCVAAIGDLTHGDAVERRVAELTALVTERSGSRADTSNWPDLVVVVDGCERLRREPGVAELFQRGPTVGIHFLCLDEDATRLPVEAAAQVVVESGPRAAARLDGAGQASATFVPDLPDRAWAEALSEELAPLEDATPDPDGPALPDRVDFVELHRLSDTCADPLDAAAVASRWRARRHGGPTAVLGASEGGPLVLDLVRDGPHALVGGTTGAGKSELLQTLVASLAVHSPPDELNFVLVDYKGGSALRDCADLPHVVGVVTDLDEHLTARALTSLGAELKRRERLLAGVGAKDLDDYRRFAARGQELGLAPEPLARLVIVVDEFKVLAEELPDFIGGLVRLAAVGRSLGIHLVLATQRPAGIVSADMRANVSLRIALRMRDRTDSDDVIEAPDAAAIPERLAGRAYLRAGPERLVSVQVAHAGHPGRSASETGLAHPVVRRLRWGDVMAPLPRDIIAEPVVGTRTELQLVAASLTDAAERLRLPPPSSPWLPPLPEMVRPTELHRGTDELAPALGDDRAVPLGLVDRPAEQRQSPLTWHPHEDGHLGVAGGARTGRTTTVIAVALRLAERFSPGELHVHLIEGTPGTLACLSALPHCGSITGTEDVQRVRRAIRRLAEGIHSARRTVVLVDGWEAITAALDELDQGESTERLVGLVRDGLSRGVTVVVTGGRAVASGRLGSLLQRRLLLDMPDPVDLTLAGIRPAAANRHRPPGRALDARDEAEVQLSLPGDDPTADYGDLARAVADAVASRHGDCPVSERPWRLAPLPEHIPIDELPTTATTPGEHVAIGVGGDDVVPLGFDLGRDERRVLVLGPPGSGRSTLLHTLAVQLRRQGRDIALVAPRRSPLRQLEGHPRCHVLAPDECDRFVALRRERPELAVLVDDCDRLEGTPLESALVEATRLVESAGGLVAVALDTRRASTAFRGLVPEVSRGGVGVVLCPGAATDGELLRARVEVQSARVPGRGVLVTDGVPMPIQVAMPARQRPTNR